MVVFVNFITVRPRSFVPFCTKGYYIKWVKTSWTDSIQAKQFHFRLSLQLTFLKSGP